MGPVCLWLRWGGRSKVESHLDKTRALWTPRTRATPWNQMASDAVDVIYFCSIIVLMGFQWAIIWVLPGRKQQTVKKLLTQIPVPTSTGNQQAVNVSSGNILVVNSMNDTRIYVNTRLYTLNWSANKYGSNATDLLMEPLFFTGWGTFPKFSGLYFLQQHFKLFMTEIS